MGMYTEILIKANVHESIPDNIKQVLNYMFNQGEIPETLPKHDFFNCSRWGFIGSGSSYYHVPWATSAYKENSIFSRSDLKNYDNEIELFFDWIKPYLDNVEGECIGHWWYEEYDEPELVIK